MQKLSSCTNIAAIPIAGGFGTVSLILFTVNQSINLGLRLCKGQKIFFVRSYRHGVDNDL